MEELGAPFVGEWHRSGFTVSRTDRVRTWNERRVPSKDPDTGQDTFVDVPRGGMKIVLHRAAWMKHVAKIRKQGDLICTVENPGGGAETEWYYEEGMEYHRLALRKTDFYEEALPF